MTTATTEELLAGALGLAPASITKEVDFENCESWDSLAHFRVIAALEEALGRSLSAEEIFSVTDYASIQSLLAEATTAL